MIRRPPRSTLFPSTPLSRSEADRLAHRHSRPHPRVTGERRDLPHHPAARVGGEQRARLGHELGPPRLFTAQREQRRSEEHTSELQSRLHLVCRLLLEKKKTT